MGTSTKNCKSGTHSLQTEGKRSETDLFLKRDSKTKLPGRGNEEKPTSPLPEVGTTEECLCPWTMVPKEAQHPTQDPEILRRRETSPQRTRDRTKKGYLKKVVSPTKEAILRDRGRSSEHRARRSSFVRGSTMVLSDPEALMIKTGICRKLEQKSTL